MVNEPEITKLEQATKVKQGPLQERLIFVSHSHADRELALAVKTLVEAAYSRLVTPFVSSDPGPTGGLMPGNEWFASIEEKLRKAEAVWVLATPLSVTRPWIYWEAGVGRALCPKGVVVVRVGLAEEKVPSPLNTFQSYDGLSSDEMTSLIGKVAAQIGMTLEPVLLEDCSKKWLERAQSHTPVTSEATEQPELLPERLDRLDAVVTRLEALESRTSEQSEPESDAAATRPGPDETRERNRRDRLALFGKPQVLYRSVADFVFTIESAPQATIFSATSVDKDGDIPVKGQTEDRFAHIFLVGSTFGDLPDASSDSKKVADLLDDIRALVERHSQE